jgi:glutamate-ammonia-ligase adenylyltransferase
LWERQALIKARGVAGDLSLFERLKRETIEPLVYGRPLPADAAVEVDRLRQRMEREIAHEGESELNLKTGHGALVDVEFATQYLQLAFGGRLPSLRTPTTLEALMALEREGCLPPADAASLREAYLFYRRVENRLRLVHGYPLARLPTSGRALALLARRLGYLGPEASAAFMKDYRTHTARVRQAYSRALQLTN